MPVVFKKRTPDRIVIEKNDDANSEPTRFFFEVSPGKTRKAKTELLLDVDHSVSNMTETLFKDSLVGWENLQDENGEQIPFSPSVRDALINSMEVFDENDVFKVFFGGIPPVDELKKKQEKAKDSTSKSRFRKR